MASTKHLRSPDEIEKRKKEYPPEYIALMAQTAKLAANEVDKGFPLLLSHSVIEIWSALEVYLTEFCSDWLLAHPECLASESMAKIKFSAALMSNPDRKTIMDSIVNEIAQSVQARLKPGVGRFQAIFEKLD